MLAPLAEVLARLELPGSETDIFDSHDLMQWNADDLSHLQALGLFEPAPPATVANCDACPESHFEDVFYVAVDDEERSSRAFISCPEYGPREVEASSLVRWKVSLKGLARTCSLSADELEARFIVPNRVLDLNARLEGDIPRRTFLVRGLTWPDAEVLLAEIASACGSSSPVILVPATAPPIQVQAVVVPLLGNLSLRGRRVVFRMPALPNQASEPLATADYQFRRVGATWMLAYGSSPRSVGHTTGMSHLARLLAMPYRSITSLELMTSATPNLPRPDVLGPAFVELTVSDGGDAGEIIDGEARDAYRDHYKQLQDDMEEARSRGDDDRIEEIRQSMAWLANQISSGTGLRGRPRRAKAPSERARISVTKAVKKAIENISKVLPPLGEHLNASVRTGATCTYSPDSAASWML